LHAAFGGHLGGAGWITHSNVLAYRTTASDGSAIPSGHGYALAGGGLHVGIGFPGAAVGHSTRGVAMHVAPFLVTIQRSV